MKSALARIATFAVLAATVAVPVGAQQARGDADSALVGHYYLNGVMETGSELLLKPDGRFEWMMAYGALDQSARGQWRHDDGRVVLTSDPVAEALRFRPFTAEEIANHPPAAADGWTVVAGIPERGPMSGVEAQFAGADGKTDIRVTGEDGMATLQPVAASRQWRRVGLRRLGRNEPWQWFDLSDARRAERFAAFFVEDAAAYRQSAFETMRLRVDGRALIPSLPWEGGKEQGRYERE